MKEALTNWLMAQCMRYAQNGCCDTEFYYDGTTFGDYVGVHIPFDKNAIAKTARYCSLYILCNSGYDTYNEFVEKEDEEVIREAWKVFIPHFEIWAESAIQDWKWYTFDDYEFDDYEFDEDDEEDEEDEDHPDYEEWFRETYCSQ